MELGADGVEFDLHLTADGVLVVHHDATVTDRTGASVPIRELPHRAVRDVRVDGEPIPTLDDVLAILPPTITAYCELKGAGTAPATVARLAAAEVRGAVHAFDHRQVAEARRLASAVPRGVLEVSYPVDALHALRSVDGRDLWRHVDFVDEALVVTAHAGGARVVAWTVNDPARMRTLAAWGVDAICTDDVALAHAVLRASGSPYRVTRRSFPVPPPIP